jgi:hypothetical protein
MAQSLSRGEFFENGFLLRLQFNQRVMLHTQSRRGQADKQVWCRATTHRKQTTIFPESPTNRSSSTCFSAMRLLSCAASVSRALASESRRLREPMAWAKLGQLKRAHLRKFKKKKKKKKKKSSKERARARSTEPSSSRPPRDHLFA